MSQASRIRLGILMALGASGASFALGASSCGGVDVPSGASGTTGGTTATTSGAGGASTTSGAGGAATTATGTGGASVTTSGSGGSGGAPLCPTGVPDKQCYTLEQLAWMIDHPPMGGSPPPPPPGPPDPADGGTDGSTDGGDGGTVLTDCVGAALVLDGCCNPASAGPSKENDLCCYWFCPGPCCGRPLVVEGKARVSGVMAREDWMGARLEETEALDPSTRAALGDAWLADARMEHASIASFARFTLELLALGAPADLLEEAQRAALDEVGHARGCFALASRYLGREVGPGPLDVTGSLPRTGLVEVAVAAVMEGCIGESIAAVVAREQLERAQDPAVRALLDDVAIDEEKHAALAFRFVRWAMLTGGNDVQQSVRNAFAEGIRQAREMAIEGRKAGADEEAFARHGRLDEGAMKRAVCAALEEVVGPCAEVAQAG